MVSIVLLVLLILNALATCAITYTYYYGILLQYSESIVWYSKKWL